MTAPARPLLPLLAVAAPFAAGAVVAPATLEDGPVLCPFRAVTGLPCPLCGSTRAVSLLMHGDPAWTSFNAVIVVALALTALWLVVRVAWPRARLPGGERSRWAAAGVLVVAAWSWTLAHADTIAPG